MDGELGAHVRAAIAKVEPLRLREDVGQRLPPDHQQQASRSSTAKDMDGLKIRVPVSPLSISMFKALGAAPASLQFSEVYSALQTKIVDAQENPLPIIQVAKLYEVQKYCSLTNHIWDGFWFIANGRAWEALPGRPEDHRRARHQRRRPAAARRHQEAQRDGAGATCRPRASPSTSPAPDSFRAKLRECRLLRRVEGPLRRRGLGAARRARSASWPERAMTCTSSDLRGRGRSALPSQCR